MNYYKLYLNLINKRNLDIKNQSKILENYEKIRKNLTRYKYSWINKFLKNYIDYSLASDKCFLRNNFLSKYFLIKSDINIIDQDKNKLQTCKSIIIITGIITAKLFKYIFDTFNTSIVLINNLNPNKEIIYLKKQKNLFLIYPDDELNKNKFSRYKAKNNLRISISKNLYGIKLVRKLFKLEKDFSKERYNIKPIEKYINIGIIFKALIIGIIIWFLIYLKSLNYIFSFLIRINHRKSSDLIYKLDFMNTILSGGLIRRLTICFTLKNILGHNQKANIYFPIEGAYWEKYLIEKFSHQNSNLYGILFSIPKILDLRFKNLLPKYESKGLCINKFYSQEKTHPYKKIKEDKYNKLFSDFFLEFNKINSSEDIIFYLTGRYNLDKEIIKDALLIIKKLKLDMIYIKVHPDTEMNIFSGIEKRIKIINRLKKSNKLIFGSIYSSYIYDVTLINSQTFILKFNIKNNIDSYVDPFKLKNVIYYDNISDILKK